MNTAARHGTTATDLESGLVERDGTDEPTNPHTLAGDGPALPSGCAAIIEELRS
ncbi:hypothetical protein [Halorientalis sp.]|uniref:hypothetical protein n=1 Tax=Halorientalis sp. TaxID=1931229 RepID=UPI0026189E8D|nr:hypothetical protein [Halorientalis sp.]